MAELEPETAYLHDSRRVAPPDAEKTARYAGLQALAEQRVADYHRRVAERQITGAEIISQAATATLGSSALSAETHNGVRQFA